MTEREPYHHHDGADGGMVASLMRPSPRYQHHGSSADATPMDSDGGARAAAGGVGTNGSGSGLKAPWDDDGLCDDPGTNGSSVSARLRAMAVAHRSMQDSARGAGAPSPAAGGGVPPAGGFKTPEPASSPRLSAPSTGRSDFSAKATPPWPRIDHAARPQVKVAPMARAHPVQMGAPLPRLTVATPTALLQGLCANGTARLAAPGANDDKDFRDPAPLSSRTGRRAGNSNCSSARTTPLTSAQPSARVISPHDMCRGMVLLEEIGRGACGAVRKGLYVPTMSLFAVKMVPVLDDERRHQMTRELTALHALSQNSSCSHIVAFHEAYTDPTHGSICMVLEYMNAGSLQDLLSARAPISERLCASVCDAVARGLDELHRRKQIHRDIKPSNILLDCSGHIKISDFGITRELNTIEVANTFVGTLAFMSPERIAGRDYSYASDIWSLGLCIIAMATGSPPFDQNSGYWAVVKKICDEQPPRLEPDAENGPAADLCDLVSRCLAKDPSARTTAADILVHPFMLRARAPLPPLSPPGPLGAQQIRRLREMTRRVLAHRRWLNLPHELVAAAWNSGGGGAVAASNGTKAAAAADDASLSSVWLATPGEKPPGVTAAAALAMRRAAPPQYLTSSELAWLADQLYVPARCLTELFNAEVQRLTEEESQLQAGDDGGAVGMALDAPLSAVATR